MQSTDFSHQLFQNVKKVWANDILSIYLEHKIDFKVYQIHPKIRQTSFFVIFSSSM